MCCVFLRARSTTTQFTNLERKAGPSYYACRPMQALLVGRKAHWATAGAPEVLQTILQKELKPILIGQGPAFPRRLRSDMWKALEYAGVQGMNTFPISTVEIAIWDIVAKALACPHTRSWALIRIPARLLDVRLVLPQRRRSVAVQEGIEDGFEEGFSGAKIKVGRSSLQDDERRIKVAMEIAGPNRRIMVDTNQKFLVPEAIQRGKVYQEMGVYWYEEPIVPYDHAGYAQVAEELEIRIAAGENEYTRYAFADLIQRRGVDVVQPDARRAGGVSEWMEIAAIADAAKLPVASHGGGPVDLQMLLSMPNAIYMESGSFKGAGSTLERLRMVNSAVLAPERPGIGSELRPEYVQKLRCDSLTNPIAILQVTLEVGTQSPTPRESGAALARVSCGRFSVCFSRS